MSNDAKITEEQLKQLQGFVQTLNQAQMQLGQLKQRSMGYCTKPLKSNRNYKRSRKNLKKNTVKYP